MENNPLNLLFSIKQINVDNILQLQKIASQTFYETFSPFNTEYDMKQYIDDNFNIEKLTRELNAVNSVFYFAMQEDISVGYLKINFGIGQTDIKDDNALEVERIYVLKEYLGKNVGQFLLQKAINVAKQENLEYLWLGVWEQNKRAIRFYEKCGFIVFDKHIFKLGDDEQTDNLMKLII